MPDIKRTRSGFTEGTCPKCRKRTFSRGNVSKHRCRGQAPKVATS